MKIVSKLFLFVLIILFPFISVSCDVCGINFGVTPIDKKSGILLNHRYRLYSFENASSILPNSASYFLKSGPQLPELTHTGEEHSITESDYDIFRIMDINASYFITDQWEIMIYVPYKVNSIYRSDVMYTVEGIGDLQLIGSYHFNCDSVTNVWMRSTIGAGIKLPTGKHDSKYNSNSLPIPYQAGSGSVDFLLNTNMSVAMESGLGSGINANYKVNLLNDDNNGMSNSFNLEWNAFYKIPITIDLLLVPKLELYYEYSNGEIKNGEKTNDHTANALFYGFGLNVYYKRFSMNGSFQIPFSANSNSILEDKVKTVLGIGYHF